MARGDDGKTVFETDDDWLVFLRRLEEACGSCGSRVHAWVLMDNHFHLSLETPEPNLVAGMKWLLEAHITKNSPGWSVTEGNFNFVRLVGLSVRYQPSSETAVAAGL